MDSKGTILYIGGFDLPDRNAAAHRVLNNARAFQEIGYKVVFCGVDKSITENCYENMNVMGFDSYPQVYPKTQKFWIKQMLSIKHYLKIISSYPDIKYIVCYNLHALPLAQILKFSKKKKIEVICDSTEWYDNKFSLNPIKFIKFIDTLLCMRVLQKRCHEMIAISTYLERYYRKYVKKIVVVPPLVDVTEEKWQQNSDGEEKDKITFVYSGQPGDTKDKIGQIVESFLCTKKTEFCKFKVIGITEDEFYKTYPSFTEQKEKISRFTEFCGRVSHIQSISELKKADYSIFIRDRSRKNMAGFPTKFVESYTSGTRIIANEISDIKKYFPEDGYSILVKDHTDNQIVVALEKAIGAGKAPKRNYENNPFDYHQWIDIYSNLF